MHASGSLLLLAVAATVGSPVRAPSAPPLAQTGFHDRVIVRVPATRASTPVPLPVRYVEKKGPKCIPADQLAGAIVVAADSVDLVMKGGKRFRAGFKDDCRALGYYGGFYVKPSLDGQVCAGRDVVRSRSGDSCLIKTFKLLIEKRAKQRKP